VLYSGIGALRARIRFYHHDKVKALSQMRAIFPEHLSQHPLEPIASGGEPSATRADHNAKPCILKAVRRYPKCEKAVPERSAARVDATKIPSFTKPVFPSESLGHCYTVSL